MVKFSLTRMFGQANENRSKPSSRPSITSTFMEREKQVTWSSISPSKIKSLEVPNQCKHIVKAIDLNYSNTLNFVPYK